MIFANNQFELREWQLSDAASVAENLNDIRIWNCVSDFIPHPYSEEDGKQFIESCLSKPKPAVDFAIVVDGKAVGGIGVVPQKDCYRITTEIGYWLGVNYWNKGIVTEAVKQIVKYAFANLPVIKIFAPVLDFNIASQKVLEKAGFEREAILKQGAIKNEKIVDMHYFSIIKQDCNHLSNI